MSRLIISDKARSDLREIWLHVATENEPAADRLIDRIYEKIALLCEHPEAGRLRPELSPDVRSFSTGVGSYILFYRTIIDGVEIVHVLHGARDIPSEVN